MKYIFVLIKNGLIIKEVNVEQKYYREEMNLKMSMGEVALICYENILDKNIMSRIIISTILELHLKKYIKFTKDIKGRIFVQIQDSNEELRKTEKLILQCLKESDIEKDNKLELEEITGNKNHIFSKNKGNIKDLIITEALEDGYIDEEKLELKQNYFNNYKSLISLIIATFLLIVGVPFIEVMRSNNFFYNNLYYGR